VIGLTPWRRQSIDREVVVILRTTRRPSADVTTITFWLVRHGHAMHACRP
jgi:hypothetical protein